MSFNILYVEDNDTDYSVVDDAVRSYNENVKGEDIVVDRARDPRELKAKLNLRFDLILSDVYFGKRSVGELGDEDKLDSVIESVKEWSLGASGGRAIPIIAYTGQGRQVLDACIRRKDDLFDIWDKGSATPEYVAWRLANLSNEVARIRPDAYLLRLIREMEGGAEWHDDVIDMARRYDQGLTERDQIGRAGESIVNIGQKMGVAEECRAMWEVMTDWEWYSRACFANVRGHARHVINVFWLGYYLLHDASLRVFFLDSWRGLVADRSGMNAVVGKDGLVCLGNAWYFAALFHDVGGCVERARQFRERQVKLLSVFGGLVAGISTGCDAIDESVCSSADDLIFEFGEPLKEELRVKFRETVERGEPDQGIIAGVHLRNRIGEGAVGCWAREGARAAAMHNIFGGLSRGAKALISWPSEPIVCLLLLCDQLQTWDRERGDATQWDDSPSRAELRRVEIEPGQGRPSIMISIDYIAPAHVMRSAELYRREMDKLNKILQAHPEATLSKIPKPWPFTVQVQCSLSGAILPTRMEFG